MATPIPTEELHEALSSYHWDLYKEVNGIRPRWYRYDEMSLEQLEEAVLRLEEWRDEMVGEWDGLDARIAADEAAQAAAEAAEAVRVREERWMDAAASMGAAGW